MKKLENIAKVTPTMKKLPQPKAPSPGEVVSANPNTETKRPPKLAGESLAKKTLEIIKRASDPAAGFLDGDCAGLSLEDKMEVTKRKLRQGYQKRGRKRRRRSLVPPKMMQAASQPMRRCTSSTVKKTFAVRTQLHMAERSSPDSNRHLGVVTSTTPLHSSYACSVRDPKKLVNWKRDLVLQIC
ncbi:hypothetical protein ZWY2020_059220 [Hordeum vulgare]|nr:hypothetical protein ZWY2020_059220 [Hordeum vulgare]